MEITEVRIKLMEDPNDRLQAFCSITFDGAFVVRDLKIIQGTKGSFVAMPSRKLTDRCPRCGCKNHLRAEHCNQCGTGLDENRALKDGDGRAKLYADIAHPINSACRELIQDRVLTAYEEEVTRSKEPGYVCTYDDYGEERFATLSEEPYDEYESKKPLPGNRRFDPPESVKGGPHHRPSTPNITSAPLAADVNDEDESFGVGL